MTTHPVSPNTVLANALHHAEDVLTPRILASPPERAVLVVDTQINGAPHIGTSLVQSLAFAMAARLRKRSHPCVTTTRTGKGESLLLRSDSKPLGLSIWRSGS